MRCLLFILRVHQAQIVANQTLLDLIHSLRTCARLRLRQQKVREVQISDMTIKNDAVDLMFCLFCVCLQSGRVWLQFVGDEVFAAEHCQRFDVLSR